jgi:hypothetical protein
MNQATLSGFVGAVAGWASGFGRWLGGLPGWVFAFLLVAFAVLRNGINVLGAWYSTYPFLIESFPTPVHPFSASWASVVPAWAFGVSSDAGWVLFHALAVGVVLVGLVVVPMRVLPDVRGRVVALVLVASPLATVLLQEIGRYDVWMIAGGVVLALARRLWVVGAGALLAVTGNPDQALALAVCLLVVSLAPSLRWFRPRAGVVFAVVVTVWVLMQVWFAAYGKLEVTRIGLMGRIFGVGSEVSPADEILTGRFADQGSWALGHFESLFAAFPLLVFSWFGVFWVVAIYLIWTMRGISRWFMLGGLIVLPALIASIFGIDGTREFVPVAWPILLALVYWGLVKPGEKLDSKGASQWGLALGAITLAAIFVPAIYVMLGRATTPYLEISEFLLFR